MSSRKRLGILDRVKARKSESAASQAAANASATASIDNVTAAVQGSRSAVSTSNASTTLLTNSSAYTGTWEDVSIYRSLVVGIATDQAGALQVQFSPDGTNADTTIQRTYTPYGVDLPPYEYPVLRRYMRVVFTNNSGSDETYLRLQVLLKV